jgi:hypothetical protein
MGFINIVSNKPNQAQNKPVSKPSNPGQKSPGFQISKISTQQMMAAGLIILGLIFLGIAILTW